MPAPSTIWSRLYRRTAALLPGAVNDRYLDEVVETFEAAHVDARRRSGAAGALLFWLRAEADLFKLAFSASSPIAPHTTRDVDMLGSFLKGSWLGDLRFAFRGFIRNPLVTGTVVLTLALGIGANTGAFSVLYNVLYQPLPYASPDEVVALWAEIENFQIDRVGMSGPDFTDIRSETTAFRALAGFASISTNITSNGSAERIQVGMVTGEFFDVFGIEAAMGRTLSAEEWAPGNFAEVSTPGFVPPPSAMVVSHAFWVNRLGADPDVLGRTFELNGSQQTVVGVMPPEFRVYLPDGWYADDGMEAWALIPANPATMPRPGTTMTVLGRLAPGVTTEEAQSQLDQVSAEFREIHPVHADRQTRSVVASLHEEVVGSVRGTLWILFGVVALVLLIACVNVGNLLLVRGLAREGEFRTRLMLGAGRIRIARQLLFESVVLSAAGAAAGAGIGWLGIRALRALDPQGLPRIGEIDLDPTVLGYTALVGMVTAGLFGLAPLFGAVRSGSAAGGQRNQTAGVGSQRIRSLLTSLELALSVILLIGAGLLFRSVGELRQVEIGFDPENVVVAQVSLPFFEYGDREVRNRFYDQILRELNEADWVEAAGAAGQIPLGEALNGFVGQYALDEASTLDPAALRPTSYASAFPGLLEALSVEMIEGRTPDVSEVTGSHPMRVVIDRRFAETHWPDRSALGERIYIPDFGDQLEGDWANAEVIGVVEPVRYESLLTPGERPMVFVPLRQTASWEIAFMIRTARSPVEVESWLRDRVSAAGPNIPVHDVVAYQDTVDDAMATQRFALSVFGIFAAIALLLAAIGLYGVLATAVAQRTKEIGLRMALGAQGRDVLRRVLRDGGRIIALGLAGGIVTAYLMAGTLEGLLFGVAATDPITFLATPLLLAAVGLISCLVPALRAVKMSPTEALRVE